MNFSDDALHAGLDWIDDAGQSMAAWVASFIAEQLAKGLSVDQVCDALEEIMRVRLSAAVTSAVRRGASP